MTWPAVAVVVAALAGQSFWIARTLDAFGKRVDDLRDDFSTGMEKLSADMRAGFDRLDARLAGIDATLAKHGERLARIEARPQHEPS